jgi:hypothetical protein
MYSRVRANGLGKRWPYQPSTTCGPETPRPRRWRPPERWSKVSEAIAQAVGVRADNCTTEVPSRIRVVCRPHHASGVKASEPHASAVNTVSKPASSAVATSSA